MSGIDNLVRLSLARPEFELKVDLSLPARGIAVLFAPSGSGKTTLLRCVAGLERGHDALVRIGGDCWQDDSRNVFLPAWQRPLGYVFQEPSLFDHLDVRRNLDYGRKRAGSTATTAVNDVIELLGIGHLLARRTSELSGGERQRVAVARALSVSPRILLLDEPLASLDHARRQEILPWLERMRDELHIPMLYVTHSVAEAARLADTLIVLEHGRVVASGPAATILADIAAPMVLGEDVGALLDGTVQARDEQWHLARLAFDGAALWMRDSGLDVGRRARVRVLARDVSLATEAPRATSIQNLLEGTVLAIAPDTHPSQALVQVQCGQCILLARVTSRAVAVLGLAPGKRVWAQVKSVALVE